MAPVAAISLFQGHQNIEHAILPRNSVQYQAGDIVPWHFMPGLIVASFFASLTGTLLTVELLHRKRLGNSIISRIHLFGCAVSMGLIGIWCMHFIGNRAIVLAHGSTHMQLIYSPGFTLLSCVLPVLGLTFAFYIAELRLKSFALRRVFDVVTGLLAGLSIVGMHYVGNLGTLNYTLIYPSRYIVAACIIAVGDCIIALALFFYFKERWISVFWKRLFCAVILAVAVCGMHYTASIGCTYRLKMPGEATAAQRNTAVIVAGTLCGIAAISVLIVLFYTNHRKKILAERAQLVMLACAYFDEDGNVMVTTEGALPSQMIAKRFALQKFDDEFGVHHPVFHWIWRVSHDWESVADLIPKMRSHVRRHDPYGGKISSASSTSSVYDVESYKDSTVLFREGYCVAAADLAERLHGSLGGLGALYDQVVGTGLLPNTKKGIGGFEDGNMADSTIFEKGQLLFFTRKLRAEETDHFTAAGFRFAPFTRVETVIARSTQIPVNLLNQQMEMLRDFADKKSSQPPPKEGVYFVCLAALARVRSSFLVLVQKCKQDELPDVQLTPHQLTPYQTEYLRNYDGWTAERFVKMIEWKDKYRRTLPNDEKSFVVLLRNALAVLAETLGEDWFFDLQFNATPIYMRYGVNKAQDSAQTTIFGFTRLLDIHHGALKQPDRLALVSWDFLKLRQIYYPGCNDHGRMRHEVHAEFGPLITKQDEQAPTQTDDHRRRHSLPKVPKVFIKRGVLKRKSSTVSRDDSVFRSDSCSVKGLVTREHESIDIEPLNTQTSLSQQQQQQQQQSSPGPTQLWGGILATTDTVIVETAKPHGHMEMRNMGPQVTATAVTQVKDPKSYVDVLYAQAKAHTAPVPKSLP